MAYLFEAFRQLIETPPGKTDLEQPVKEETHTIISTIDQQLFETQTREQAQFYILKVEIAIGSYESRINTLLQHNDSISRARQLHFCHAGLDKIRHHLETTYHPYRDPCSPVSRKTMTKLAKQISLKKDKLARLIDRCEVSCKLKNIILYPANEIIASKCCEISQQKVEYITTFINELIDFIESLGEINEESLLHHLYLLNFNTTPLLSYICDHYKSIRADIDDEELLLEQLYDYKSKINKLPLALRPPFNSDLRDLKEQVRCWIDEEIALIKKMVKQSRKKKETIHPRLKFNYSVEVISGFYRLLHDAGVTSSGANQTVRWIARNISSKNQPNISPQSIQRRFFEKNSNKEPLKEIVIHLLNHLNRK